MAQPDCLKDGPSWVDSTELQINICLLPDDCPERMKLSPANMMTLQNVMEEDIGDESAENDENTCKGHSGQKMEQR